MIHTSLSMLDLKSQSSHVSSELRSEFKEVN